MLPPDQIERITREGAAARRLLEGEDFGDVMNALDLFHLSALVACPTGEAAKPTRDYHHERLHALREIIAEVSSRAQALDAFIEHQDTPDDNED